VIVVVSDTSPLRALYFLRKLDILEMLFGTVFLPPAIAEELIHPGPRFQPLDPKRYAFLHVSPPQDHEKVRLLRKSLDPGESEAIVLALEKHADFILMDESAGRGVAQEMKLTPLGTVGILLRAKERQLIDSIAPLLDHLQSKLGFYIKDSLYQF
jgi:predicted nucleic acid-binding protein